MLLIRALALLTFTLCLAGCSGEETGTAPSGNSSGQQGTPAETADHQMENTPEPEPEAETLAPEDVKLTKANWDEVLAAVATHKGKVVVLDIWSTACQPCLREFPNLVNLSQKYPDRVVCLSLNTDYFGSASKPPEFYENSVRKVLSEMNAKFDNYLCTVPSDEIYTEIDLGAIPAVYVFGPEGTIAERFDNDEQKYGEEFTYSEHIVPKIESLLKPAE